MALMGYNPKRKNTPPPVKSVEIYHMNSMDVPTPEGRVNITSQLLTSITLIPSKSDCENELPKRSTKLRHRKQAESSSTPSDGHQFQDWRSSESERKKKKTIENQETSKTNKPSKDTSRSRSLTPNHYSSNRSKPSMKRSATFSGKVKKSKDIKHVDHYRNAKMMEESTKWMNCVQMLILIVGILLIYFCMFNSNYSIPPYDHNEVLINITGFQKYLKHDFFRQKYTVNVLLETLKEELNGKKHEHPLVLSFHGGSGVGKTFLAEATVKHLFINGLDSQCVHNFISSLHIADRGDTINRDIVDWFLQQTFVRCPLEMFIVDNMEILTPELVDYLLQRIQESLSDSSVVKSAILILTTTIGKEQLLIRNCENEICYLETTEILKKELQSWKLKNTMQTDVIDLESPNQSVIFLELCKILVFFPLQREDVKLCAQRVLQQYLPTEEITDKLLEMVASEISFLKFGNGKEYSSSGCKQVAEKVILHI